MSHPAHRETQSDALRDAQAIVERAEADEREADAARRRYREVGLPRLDPDADISAELRPDESVIEVRPAASIGRHVVAHDVEALAGRLYLTTARLILRGRAALQVELGEVEELALAGERLLVTLTDGTGLDIDAGAPRLLRVQVAAARAAARAV